MEGLVRGFDLILHLRELAEGPLHHLARVDVLAPEGAVLDGGEHHTPGHLEEVAERGTRGGVAGGHLARGDRPGAVESAMHSNEKTRSWRAAV